MDKNKKGEDLGVKVCHIDKLEETFPSDCKIASLAISEKKCSRNSGSFNEIRH